MSGPFVRAANPIWFMVDHVGQPLNDEYYISFLTNTFPYLPQNVYQDVNGTIPWPNPLEFQPSGTLPNNLYFDESLVYRLEVRQGPTQSDPLIWEINNFVPGIGMNPNTNQPILSAENQVSNPQFFYVNFTNDDVITQPGTYFIAPGWDLVLTGIGTATLTQLVLTGVDTVPYGIRFNLSGWSTAYLQQTFNDIGSLYDTGAIAMSLVGKAEVSPKIITMNLLSLPSPPGSPQEIASGTLNTGNFQIIAGIVNLNAPTNSDANNISSLVLQIILPGTGIVDLSDIQMVGQSSPLSTPITLTIPFQDETIERQTDHLFHYYSDSLITKPKISLLAGWNFPLNPYQFITTTITTVPNQTQYIADQTIIYQAGGANSVKTGKSSVSTGQGLTIQSINGVADNRFALIQYIDPRTIAPYWSNYVSSMVRGGLFTTNGTNVKLKMRLILRSSLPSAISPTEPIASWASTDPVFSAGWSTINPINDPSYSIIDGQAIEFFPGYPSYPFEGMLLEGATSSVMTLGIVIYTVGQLNSSLGTEDFIVFDKISLTPTFFAADANPETYDESLRKCQFYYEKSYDPDTLPGTTTALGQQFQTIPLYYSLPNVGLYIKTFHQNFKTIKRINPSVGFYSITGTPNVVQMGIYLPASGYVSGSPSNFSISNYSEAEISLNGTTMYSANPAQALTTTAAGDAQAAPLEGHLFYQYTADARLGIV